MKTIMAILVGVTLMPGGVFAQSDQGRSAVPKTSYSVQPRPTVSSPSAAKPSTSVNPASQQRAVTVPPAAAPRSVLEIQSAAKPATAVNPRASQPPAAAQPTAMQPARGSIAAPKPTEGTSFGFVTEERGTAPLSIRDMVNAYYAQRASYYGANQGTTFDRFSDALNSQEAKHGRYHSKKSVLDLLANSSVFASDVGRYADEFGNPGNMKDPESLINSIYKNATDAELSSFALGLVAEQSVQQALVTEFAGYKGQQAINIQKEIAIQMNPLVSIQAWLNDGKKTKDKENGDSGLPGSVPTSADGFNKSQLPFSGGGDSFMNGSCLKKFSANLPAGVAGASNNSAPFGDMAPDGGGFGGGEGADGKPVTIGKAADAGSLQADCSAVDFAKMDKGSQAGKPPAGAETKSASKNALIEHKGPNGIRFDMVGLRVDNYFDDKGKSVGTTVSFDMENKNGDSILPDGESYSKDGPGMTPGNYQEIKVKTSQGTVTVTITMNKAGNFSIEIKDKNGGKTNDTTTVPPPPTPVAQNGQGQQSGSAATTVNPMSEGAGSDNQKAQCMKSAYQTAGDCAMSFIAGINNGVDAYNNLTCLKKGGGVAKASGGDGKLGGGIVVTGTTTGPDGADPMLKCGKEMGIEGLDQMKMFMKMGGGFSDPGKSKPLSIGSTKQVQTNDSFSSPVQQQNQNTSSWGGTWFK